MRLGATGILCGLAWGALLVGLPTAAGAQDAAPQVTAPQVEPGTAALSGTYQPNSLTISDVSGRKAHVFPTVSRAAAMKSFATTAGTPLTYHGGPIMPTLQIYNIFWKPATLQSGAVANMSAHFMSVANGLAFDYVGHAINNNNTQYYQMINSAVTYVSGLTTLTSNYHSLGGNYLDTNAYPASGCTDTATPKNCLTDTQLQTEVKRVMALEGWVGGLGKIYMIYTAQGEGSCFDSSGSECAFTNYCAYHSSFTSGSTTVIYANEPFAVLANCQNANQPSPTGDPTADATMTSASHEISEAVTDPTPGNPAWIDSSGSEIGDKCAYNYGTNTYDSGKANQFWNGRYYELQMEWDNHAAACVQGGP